jgi:hypothetical protein
MAEETTPVDEVVETSADETVEQSAAPVDDTPTAENAEATLAEASGASTEPAQTDTETNAQTSDNETSAEAVAPSEASAQQETAPAQETVDAAPEEPDALQPYIDKAFETIQNEVTHEELDQFLRSHVKTFREEWDTWPDSAKDAYLHMMTSQLLQRQASTIRIMNYEEYKLPKPSAQTKLFESIKQSQIKPKKCIPVLLLPPNLRPTYSLKK